MQERFHSWNFLVNPGIGYIVLRCVRIILYTRTKNESDKSLPLRNHCYSANCCCAAIISSVAMHCESEREIREIDQLIQKFLEYSGSCKQCLLLSMQNRFSTDEDFFSQIFVDRCVKISHCISLWPKQLANLRDLDRSDEILRTRLTRDCRHDPRSISSTARKTDRSKALFFDYIAR